MITAFDAQTCNTEQLEEIRNAALGELYKSKKLRSYVYKIFDAENHMEDVIHEVFIYLKTISIETFIQLYERNALDFVAFGLLKKFKINNTRELAKQKKTIVSFDQDSIDDVETFTAFTPKDSLQVSLRFSNAETSRIERLEILKACVEQIEQLSYLDKKILILYCKYGTVKSVRAKINMELARIGENTIAESLKNSRTTIQQNLLKQGIINRVEFFNGSVLRWKRVESARINKNLKIASVVKKYSNNEYNPEWTIFQKVMHVLCNAKQQLTVSEIADILIQKDDLFQTENVQAIRQQVKDAVRSKYRNGYLQRDVNETLPYKPYTYKLLHSN